MDLRPVGGIFWRLDASGNLTAYDTAGNVVAAIIGGTLVGRLFTANYSISNSSGTTSTSAVSSGIGVQITPRVNTRILILSGGAVNSTVAADQAFVQVYRNTSGVPSHGTAVGSDTIIVAGGFIDCRLTTAVYYFSGNKTDTTVTVGTTYFYYIGYARAAGTGTITLQNTFGIAAGEL